MNLPRREIIDLYAKAKCFVFPPEEDFWLVPVEAQACGTPVIAYGVGGALETVIPPSPTLPASGREQAVTGIFFQKQSPESLQKAIDQFETMTFNANEIRKNAEKFDSKIFKEKLVNFIERKLKK